MFHHDINLCYQNYLFGSTMMTRILPLVRKLWHHCRLPLLRRKYLCRFKPKVYFNGMKNQFKIVLVNICMFYNKPYGLFPQSFFIVGHKSFISYMVNVFRRFLASLLNHLITPVILSFSFLHKQKLILSYVDQLILPILFPAEFFSHIVELLTKVSFRL